MRKVLTQKAKQDLQPYLTELLTTTWEFLAENVDWTPDDLDTASRELQVKLSLASDCDTDPSRTLSDVEIKEVSGSYCFLAYPYFIFPDCLKKALIAFNDSGFGHKKNELTRNLQTIADTFNRGQARVAFILERKLGMTITLYINVKLSADEVEEV